MSEEDIHYPDHFVNALQAIWGDGFLSPGGPAEVAEILDGIDLSGKEVLDVGCGVGGIDLLLVEKHGAARVIAIDVEPQLIEHAARRFHAADLGDVIEARLVEPGPLPLEDASIDAVFSKDAMLHIPDKSALYADVLRVLRPGGLFAASDWLRGGADDDPPPDVLVRWGQTTGLDAAFATPSQTEHAMQAAGFDNVRVRDRHDWYLVEIDKEGSQVTGPGFQQLEAALGMEAAVNRAESYAVRREAVEAGALRPCHLFGTKPA